MNFFIFNKSKPDSKSSNTWRETMIAREDKKYSLKTEETVTEQITVTSPMILTNTPRIICTSDNFKKSVEENQKIKDVHDELSQLSFTPNLAF